MHPSSDDAAPDEPLLCMVRLDEGEDIEIIEVKDPAATSILQGAIYPFIELMKKQAAKERQHELIPRNLSAVTIDEIDIALGGSTASTSGVAAPCKSFVKYPHTPLTIKFTMVPSDSSAAQQRAEARKKDLAKAAVSTISTPTQVEAAKDASERAARDAETALAAEQRASAAPSSHDISILGKSPYGGGGAESKVIYLTLGDTSVTAYVSKEFQKKPLSAIILPFVGALKQQAGNLRCINVQTEAAPLLSVLGVEEIAMALSAPASTWLTDWGVYTSMELRMQGAEQGDTDGFIAADTFEGDKPGYAFKMGTSGLGYYISGVVVKSAAAAAEEAAFNMED